MKGRCFCGFVEYELTSPIQDSYYCHCRDCQYMSGSSFRVLGIVGSDSLDFKSGELSEFGKPGQIYFADNLAHGRSTRSLVSQPDPSS